MLVKTADGWRIMAMGWTEPRANAAVNRDAKAGKLSARSLGEDPGDASLCDAFARLTTAGSTRRPRCAPIWWRSAVDPASARWAARSSRGAVS